MAVDHLAALVMAFLSLSTTPSILAQDQNDVSTKDLKLYNVDRGKYEIEKTDGLTLTDPKHTQPLQLRVTYPKTPGDKLPVIVFSHGAGGSKKSYEPLIEHWASHGYICLQPTHGDSMSLMERGQFRKYGSLREYVNSGMLAEHQLTRPDDIKLVLDQLPAIEVQISAIQGQMDRKRIGMGGHSFGAHTTQMIGGLSLRDFRNRNRMTADDQRPKALLMISPQGRGGQIDDESWKNITRPTMVVTGTNDQGRNGQSYKWRLEVFEHLPAKEKYLAFIKDATHNFGGISGAKYPGSGPENPDHVNYVRSATLAFWDAQLKDDPAAKEYLQSDNLAEATRNQATISRSKSDGK